jgi:sulfhydrogenase subunit gamma (sulfur reductase)
MCNCNNNDKSIYLPKLAPITKVAMMNETEMYMHVDCEIGHMPGQFVEVSIAGIGEAPISISSSPTQQGFDMVIRKAGRVTNIMHQMQAGDKIGIRGPFGKEYPIDEFKGKDMVLICGGIGLVPQRAMINYIMDNRADFGKVAILQGTKEFGQRLFHDELQRWAGIDGVQVLETIDEADDNWDGNVGVVTKLISEIEGIDLTKSVNLICGPPIMYKFVLMVLQEKQVPHENVFVNLERRMKCGVGKCGHCQMNGQYVCQSGPVYRYSDLANVPEAI